MFTVWNADGCGAHIEVAMLVVTALRLNGVEMEFDVNGVGEEVAVVVGARQDVELAEALAPLLGSLRGRRIAK